MTMHKPTIKLDRLYVSRNGQPAYDETFHDGINIIRGHNGSGKSTIAEFIRYALGGTINIWKQEAGLCDFVIAQVSFNGIPVSLKREVSDQKSRPMSIYWGPFDEAITNVAGWELYPYSRSNEKQSFSQRIFNFLELPEIRGEFGENITLHQLSRLFYVDQRTSFAEIFVDDGNFDSHDKRGAVADYMCGIFIDDLYNSKLTKRELDDEWTKLRAERSGITRILAGSNIATAKEAFDAEIKNTNDLLAVRKGELEELMSQKWDKSKIEDAVKGEIKGLEKDILGLRGAQRKQKERMERLEYEIADSENFIIHLNESHEALGQSIAVSEYIGVAKFEHCPSCFTEVGQSKAEDKCSLCGKDINVQKISARNQRLKSELKFQIQESQSLQKERETELETLKSNYRSESMKLTNLEKRYAAIRVDLVSGAERAIGKINQDIGYLERKSEELNGQLKLAERIGFLDNRMAEIQAEIEKINSKLESYERRQQKTRSQIVTAISDYTVELLHKDLAREDTFKNAQSVHFDFREGKIFTVVDKFSDNRPREFSASSMVYLKNSFHLAMHLASLDLNFMRYPRFTLFDDIEDKGMEPERSQNFQRQLVEKIKQQTVSNQVIFTTSMIAPELDNSVYTVGEFYTETNKTLKGFASTTGA